MFGHVETGEEQFVHQGRTQDVWGSGAKKNKKGTGGLCGSRGRASALLLEGHWFDSPGLHVGVSLGEILDLKLLLMCWAAFLHFWFPRLEVDVFSDVFFFG